MSGDFSVGGMSLTRAIGAFGGLPSPANQNIPPPSSGNAGSMTVTFDAKVGLAVTQLHDMKGNVILSLPSLKALDAYRTAMAQTAPDAANANSDSMQTDMEA